MGHSCPTLYVVKRGMDGHCTDSYIKWSSASSGSSDQYDFESLCSMLDSDMEQEEAAPEGQQQQQSTEQHLHQAMSGKDRSVRQPLDRLPTESGSPLIGSNNLLCTSLEPLLFLSSCCLPLFSTLYVAQQKFQMLQWQQACCATERLHCKC